MSYPAYEVLQVSRPADCVVHVQLNRPDKSNAMDHAFIRCVMYACVGGRVSSLWQHVLVWEHALCYEPTRGLLGWQ